MAESSSVIVETPDGLRIRSRMLGGVDAEGRLKEGVTTITAGEVEEWLYNCDWAFEGEFYGKSVKITANSECDKCDGIFVRDGEE